MEINKEQLLEGKATIIKNKSFGSTKSYVDPFFSILDELDPEYEISVIPPAQTTIVNGQEDITYNRVHVKAILDETYSVKIDVKNQEDWYDVVIGLVYGLDLKIPVIKFYKSYLRRSDSTLFVIDNGWINIQEINEENEINYDVIKNLIKTDNEDTIIALNTLLSDKINRVDKYNLLGAWTHKCLTEEYLNGFSKTKLTKSSVIDVYKNTFIDEKSDYFVSYEEEIDKHMIYFAFGDLIKNEKDILNKFEKTLLINRILDVNSER